MYKAIELMDRFNINVLAYVWTGDCLECVHQENDFKMLAIDGARTYTTYDGWRKIGYHVCKGQKGKVFANGEVFFGVDQVTQTRADDPDEGREDIGGSWAEINGYM